MAMLKIIDNPNNDIPLVTVLRSVIGGFTDNELLEIKLGNKKSSYYEAIYGYLKSVGNVALVVPSTKQGVCNTPLQNKIRAFLTLHYDLASKSEHLKLHELIWYIYEKTGYFSYVSSMANGELKVANLKRLFEKAKEYESSSLKGLSYFINYLDKISKSSGDTSRSGEDNTVKTKMLLE